jgi:NADP-dependent 3-hydroxy acid dehydrogenase YdfG
VDYQLSGKVAVVTGASAGIGRAIATLLASEGVRVVGVARREPALLELKAEIEQHGSGEFTRSSATSLRRRLRRSCMTSSRVAWALSTSS